MLAATATTAVACLSPKPTTLSTTLSGGGKEGEEITVTEGTGVKDTATLKGENASKATGTVKYAVYKDKECKELVTKAGEVTVKEGKVPPSEEEKLEAGAVYYWQAEYGGDSLDEASKSPCGKEILTVKAKTSLATTLSGGGKEGEEITISGGTGVKDTAILSGTNAAKATGTVDYAVYKDKECKELATKAGEGKVEGTKAASSEEKELEATAVYYWQAEYLGDSLHEKSTSPCGKEVLNVIAPTAICAAEPVVEEGVERCSAVYQLEAASMKKVKILNNILTVECDVSFLGTESNSESVVFAGKFSYSNCGGCEVTEENGPSTLEFSWRSYEEATVIGKGLLKVSCGETLSCSFSATGLEGSAVGALSAANKAGEISFVEQKIVTESGSLCPEEATVDLEMGLPSYHIVSGKLVKMRCLIGFINTFLNNPDNKYCTGFDFFPIGNYDLAWQF
ncbi:MAG TPA: hypothetical protein VF245_02535 [Solirubrobacterales bacterium]